MHGSGSRHYVGLDIGTTTVRCVVGLAEPDDSLKLSIIGHGQSNSAGMRKGQIVSIDQVAEAVSEALTSAERHVGGQINSATVNVNGSSVSGMNSHGVIAISAANREITTDDRSRVEEAASIVKMPSNREIVQIFAQGYSLDGQDNIKDPVGMRGVRLEVDTHIITAPTPNLRNLDLVLEKARIRANNRTVSGLAAAEAVLSTKQKEAGALVIDIGGGSTNIAVIEDGEVQHVAVLPVGGNNITNDLAIGLETDLEIAELVKLKFATLAEEPKRRYATFQYENQNYSFDIGGDQGIYAIVEARVEEILEWVAKELQKIKRTQKLPGGIVVVGGSAVIPGMAEFVKQKLHLSTKIGVSQRVTGLVESVASPAYATAIGLATLDMLLTSDSGSNLDRGFGSGQKIGKGLKSLLSHFR